MIKSQKEKVVELVKELVQNYDGTQKAKKLLSKEEIKYMTEVITKDMIEGRVVFNKDKSDITKVRKYVIGMISNHLRKAKELGN